MKQYNTAGPRAMMVTVVMAIIMISATTFILPPIQPNSEFGTCLPFSTDWIPRFYRIPLNTLLIAIAIAWAFILNKRYSFVKGAEMMLPVSLCVLITSNPANTSCFNSSVAMLIVNLICLGNLMKSYHARNATTEMFAIATYLSLGSMVEYAFLPFLIVYPVMAIVIKAFRIKEFLAYLMGILAPYWVALGFGFITIYDFRLPEFMTMHPVEGGDYMILVYIGLGLMALISFIMSAQNALRFYSGNIQFRSFNNLINILGVVSTVCMVLDFDNFEAYCSSFCFTSAVAISNFFAIRHIPHSRGWFWSLLSLFLILFIIMLLW